MRLPNQLKLTSIALAILILLFATTGYILFPPSTLAADTVSGDRYQQGNSEPQDQYPLMRPSPETLRGWMERRESLPRVNISPQTLYQIVPRPETPKDSFSLLDYLEYSPSERDQGHCGNCWVWAGTGIMEVALNLENGIRDRLSIQYFNSNYHGGTGDWAGNGGDLPWFADFYAETGMAIPWSNTNAYWQDGNLGYDASHTSVPADTISAPPHYSISHAESQLVPTWETGESAAITNIKAVLRQGRAMQFGFYLADWQPFFNFWSNQPETDIWEPEVADGGTWTWDDLGGHGVLCVGYNDSPGEDNDYWIMLNSWGTTEGRPNGLFRVDMHLNYDCQFQVPGEGWYYNFDWQTLDIDFSCYGFGDPQRGTKLCVDTAEQTFRFTAPDGYDSGTIKAQFMKLRNIQGYQSIIIKHSDCEIRLLASTLGARDFLVAQATDRKKGKTYYLIDPPGIELQRVKAGFPT